jgi:hypothetical protein
LGTEKLRGRNCYRVASTTPDGTRILWIDCEDYLLRRMELPVATHRAAVDPGHNFLSLRVWIDIEEPTLDPSIDERSFVLEAPGNAKRVRHFVLPPRESSTDKVLEKENSTGEENSATDSDELPEARENHEPDVKEATVDEPDK